MGNDLVRAAYEVADALRQLGADLSTNERAVLVYICHRADDRHSLPAYWGGRRKIARNALGRDPDSDPAKTRSIYESLRQAVAALANKGLIKLDGAAYPGHQQVYQIQVREMHLELVVPPRRQQAEIGPFASSTWAKNNDRLQMAQADVGPETKETNLTKRKPTSLRRAPHVRPVERSEGAA